MPEVDGTVDALGHLRVALGSQEEAVVALEVERPILAMQVVLTKLLARLGVVHGGLGVEGTIRRAAKWEVRYLSGVGQEGMKTGEVNEN